MSDKLKINFFRSAIELKLLHDSIRTLTSNLKKKVDGEYTPMLRAALNTLWRVHVTNKELQNHSLNTRTTITIHRTLLKK